MSARFGHGLVVGKFYPPHAGHHHLIDAALERCDHVTVVVAASARESIPLDLRREWIQRRHPAARVVAGHDETPVDYGDPAVWDAHVAVFKSLCPERVDAVFTSEDYGDELARRFDASHVLVDRERQRVPVSGVAIRQDPAAHWQYLDPSARAWLTKRVAVVGAESTGTTTLARDLAERYETVWVPEYGRELTEGLVLAGTPLELIDWNEIDFSEIAREQQRREDEAALQAGPVLICDTDALATCIWRERYVGSTAPELERLAAASHHALYILTSDDIPFAQDGLRDGEDIRRWMTERFRERLDERNEPWVEVRGTREERLATASYAIDDVVASGWQFEEPL